MALEKVGSKVPAFSFFYSFKFFLIVPLKQFRDDSVL